MPKLFVVFATTSASKRRWSRRAAYWMIRHLTRSEIVHVAAIMGHFAINATFDGNRIFWATDFVIEHPSLVLMYEIDVGRHVDVRRFEDARPNRLASSVLQFCTRGTWPSRDCVATTKRVLREAGVPVPRRIVTPVALFDWLRKEGYDLAELA